MAVGAFGMGVGAGACTGLCAGLCAGVDAAVGAGVGVGAGLTFGAVSLDGFGSVAPLLLKDPHVATSRWIPSHFARAQPIF